MGNKKESQKRRVSGAKIFLKRSFRGNGHTIYSISDVNEIPSVDRSSSARKLKISSLKASLDDKPTYYSSTKQQWYRQKK